LKRKKKELISQNSAKVILFYLSTNDLSGNLSARTLVSIYATLGTEALLSIFKETGKAYPFFL
jgi:hypothetical protein